MERGREEGGREGGREGWREGGRGKVDVELQRRAAHLESVQVTEGKRSTQLLRLNEHRVTL